MKLKKNHQLPLTMDLNMLLCHRCVRTGGDTKQLKMKNEKFANLELFPVSKLKWSTVHLPLPRVEPPWRPRILADGICWWQWFVPPMRPELMDDQHRFRPILLLPAYHHMAAVRMAWCCEMINHFSEKKWRTIGIVNTQTFNKCIFIVDWNEPTILTLVKCLVEVRVARIATLQKWNAKIHIILKSNLALNNKIRKSE